MSKVVPFPGTEKVFLRLPTPPTANNMFANVAGKGRVKARGYLKWRNEALCQVAIMHRGKSPISGPVSVEISLKRPRKNADIDNRIKPVLDLLQAAAVIDDDKNVQEIAARWDDAADGCEVTVSPLAK